MILEVNISRIISKSISSISSISDFVFEGAIQTMVSAKHRYQANLFPKKFGRYHLDVSFTPRSRLLKLLYRAVINIGRFKALADEWRGYRSIIQSVFPHNPSAHQTIEPPSRPK
jgi:hypothetical protein